MERQSACRSLLACVITAVDTIEAAKGVQSHIEDATHVEALNIQDVIRDRAVAKKHCNITCNAYVEFN